MVDDGLFADHGGADEVAENNARRDEVRRQLDDTETIKRLLSHKNGRAWFHRWLSKCHIFDTPFTPGQPETTFFAMGQENIGKQMMMQAIDACSDLYLLMIAEARREEARLAELAADLEKKQKADYDAAVRTQGFELPPPPGFPGHVPPKMPEKKD